MVSKKEVLGICRSIWKDKSKIYLENKATDTEVAIKQINNIFYVIFKSTDSKQDVEYNFDYSLVKSPWGNDKVKIHNGFLTKMISIIDILDNTLIDYIKDYNDNNDNNVTIIFSGFSQGGAMAQLAIYRYSIDNFLINSLNKLNLKTKCYAYGSPRVGNNLFVKEYNKHIKNTCRVYYRYDPVPSLPPKFLLYNDTKNAMWIDKNGKKNNKDRPWWLSLKIITEWKFKIVNHWKIDHGSQKLFNSL